LFRHFEKLVHPYPDAEPAPPPKAFFAFLWAGTRGLRPYLLALTVLSAGIGAFEALLFSMMGRIVDWLGKVEPTQLWAQERGSLLLLVGVLVGSIALVWLASAIKHLTLGGNFPMLLRWNFHRLMLSQSMSFYQDEFAGRVAAKVMQTALAVRDAWFVVCELIAFVVIYFVTLLAVLGSFASWMVLPFIGWLALYVACLWYFVPRLGRVSQAQADARSLMTGRITDAYTNIATVKLFSHAGREAGYARGAMEEFLSTVYTQMRLVTAFEVVNHALSVLLIIGTTGVALWLWISGAVGVGAVAAATAMALRLNGISHWVMWEMATLFENIGTVQDGIVTLSRAHTVIDRPGAQALAVTQGEIRFEQVGFAYGATGPEARNVVDKLSLHIRPGEKIGLVGRSGAGKSTVVNLLLRFHDVAQGRVLIDGQDIAHVTQDSLRAQIGMVTQDTSLLHRSVRDNILYGRAPRCRRRADARCRLARRGTRVHPGPLGCQGPARLRRPRGRARRQALGRAAPAHRHCARDAERCAHPVARRGDQCARFGSRGRHPGEPLPLDGGQDRGGHCAPPEHHRRDGPAGGARQGPCRRRGRPPQPAGAGRPVRAAVGAPERRFPRRRGR
jgi:ATP-binding cassette, subfamily B, multidrug efflux pump